MYQHENHPLHCPDGQVVSSSIGIMGPRRICWPVTFTHRQISTMGHFTHVCPRASTSHILHPHILGFPNAHIHRVDPGNLLFLVHRSESEYCKICCLCQQILARYYFSTYNFLSTNVGSLHCKAIWHPAN